MDCANCKCEIPKERLEAIPDTIYCVKCAELFISEIKAEFKYSTDGEPPRHW